jgi:hypothetical protein
MFGKRSKGGTATKDRTGSFRSRFTAREWEQVLQAPWVFFGMAAQSDGTIDEAESHEFAGRMTQGGLLYKDPLHREVATAMASAPRDVMVKAMSSDPSSLRELLKRKLTPEEYQGFVSSMWIDANAVAHASEGLSDDETKALTALALFFEVDVMGMKGRFEAKD